MNNKFSMCVVMLGVIALSIPGTRSLSATPHRRSASGSCVQCGFNANNCRTCVGGGGALMCETFNCGVCEETGDCGGEGGPEGGGEPSPETPPKQEEPKGGAPKNKNKNASPKQDPPSNTRNKNESTPIPNKEGRIDGQTIRRIALMHPRFAATLANLNYASSQSRSITVHWTPVKISSKDIEAFINRKEHYDYFKKFEEESRRLNSLIYTGRLTEIVYNVTIQNPNPYAQIIRIQAVGEYASSSMDPAYSLLEVRTTYSKSAVGALARVSTTWQLSPYDAVDQTRSKLVLAAGPALTDRSYRF